MQFLSTLSLRRATHPIGVLVAEIIISIHALLAESDYQDKFSVKPVEKFLSTLSLRRATVLRKVPILGIKYFYPRSPCGERLHLYASTGIDFAISIHALLAESDGFSCFYIIKITNFYPRSPCGERPKIL